MKVILGGDKLKSILRLLDSVSHIEGEIAECGVYHGATLKKMAERCPKRHVFGFDTWEGLPPEHWIDGEPHGVGDFGDVTFEAVRRDLSHCPNVALVRGVFPDTAQPYRDMRFAFVHIDFDWESSTRAAIEFFRPRMAEGGVMVFDDYDWKHCPGVRRAIEACGLVVRQDTPNQAYLRC